MKDKLRVDVRTSVEEMVQLGTAVAERLNRYNQKELVKVLIPRKGFSSLSAEEGPLFDPVADEAFARTLRRWLDHRIDVVEVDANNNDLEFARAVAAALRNAVSCVNTDALH